MRGGIIGRDEKKKWERERKEGKTKKKNNWNINEERKNWKKER